MMYHEFMNVDHDPSDRQALINVAETAEMLNLHVNTIRNWAKQGKLKSVNVPGSKINRFDARDIRRLAKDRGEPVSSVEPELRTIGPELIDASQLSVWAGSRQSQELFPELMRRLLARSAGVSDISVPTGDGIYAHGWDGIAKSRHAKFLPHGILYFEFGTDAKPATKASNDLKLRLDDSHPDGIFVFATPKRWATRLDWEKKARVLAKDKFADVRAIDADALEGWLRETPDVHHWISEQLGRHPAEVTTLDGWQKRFAARTTPELPSALFLAGRQTQRDELLAFLASNEQTSGTLTIRAPWRDDAVAFVAATLEEFPSEQSRAMTVESPRAWAHLVQSTGSLTLIPLYPEADIAAAATRGHKVLLAMGNDEKALAKGIELPKPSQEVATEALKTAAGDLSKASKWASLARRSMPALIRLIAHDRRLSQAAWAADHKQAATLGLLVLAGSWGNSDGDTAVLELLTERPWPEIERALRGWVQTGDAPFVESGNVWKVASPVEASIQLFNSLTAADMKRWIEVVTDVLAEKDPRADLAPTERFMAGLNGIGRQRSGTLRKGMARGLALLSAYQEHIATEVNGTSFADAAVHTILARVKEDLTGQTLESLQDVLPLVAEASPQLFLDFVDTDLQNSDSLLSQMFKDSRDDTMFGPSSPHPSVLWALECLAWSPAYLPQSARALAQLAQLDPGGRLSNRPNASLANILLPWRRNTSAKADVRLSVLRAICKAQPAVGWGVLLAIWPSHHAISFAPHAPEFHDWQPPEMTVSMAEWFDFINQLVSLTITEAGSDPARWARLMTIVSALPRSDRTRVLDSLEALLASETFDAEWRLTLWDPLRQEISHHQQFPDADWAMSTDDLARMNSIATQIEPVETGTRFAYLFGWHPDLPGVSISDDTVAYQLALEAARAHAVVDMIATSNEIDLEKLAKDVEVPGHLGWTLARQNVAFVHHLMLTWLDSPLPNLRQVAAGWSQRRLAEHGPDWMKSVLRESDMSVPERRRTFVVNAPANSEFWKDIDELEDDVAVAYWRALNAYRVPKNERTEAIGRMLAHDRPWAALTVAALTTQPDDQQVSVALAKEIIRALISDSGENMDPQMAGYELGKLLDLIAAENPGDDDLPNIEFTLYPLLEHHRTPNELNTLLANSPAAFVDLVSRIYRGKNSPVRPGTAEEQALARQSWTVLRNWRTLPGLRSDGTIDEEKLNLWVRQARLAFLESDRVDIGDEQIGQILSASPTGLDGLWPTEPVRNLIETVGSTHLESGIYLGIVNSRGIKTRGPFDGGTQEHTLAERYETLSQATSVDWPRTSRILRQITGWYQREGRENDAEAERWADA
jgi:hypothetical protein